MKKHILTSIAYGCIILLLITTVLSLLWAFRLQKMDQYILANSPTVIWDNDIFVLIGYLNDAADPETGETCYSYISTEAFKWSQRFFRTGNFCTVYGDAKRQFFFDRKLADGTFSFDEDTRDQSSEGWGTMASSFSLLYEFTQSLETAGLTAANSERVREYFQSIVDMLEELEADIENAGLPQKITSESDIAAYLSFFAHIAPFSTEFKTVITSFTT